MDVESDDEGSDKEGGEKMNGIRVGIVQFKNVVLNLLYDYFWPRTFYLKGEDSSSSSDEEGDERRANSPPPLPPKEAPPLPPPLPPQPDQVVIRKDYNPKGMCNFFYRVRTVLKSPLKLKILFAWWLWKIFKLHTAFLPLET